MPSRTSRMTSSVFSGGRAAMIFLKGAASSLTASQAYCGGPGHGHSTLVLDICTSRNPAERMTPAHFCSSAKRKTSGASGGGGGTFLHAEERAEHGGEDGILFRRTPNNIGKAAAGFQPAAMLGQGFRNVRKEHQAEAAGNAIKFTVRKGQVIGVGNLTTPCSSGQSRRHFLARFGAFPERHRWPQRGRLTQLLSRR